MDRPEGMEEQAGDRVDARRPAGRLRDRLVGFSLAAAALSLLVLAASLAPAAAGVGTHTQLGLAPCGFLAATGLPCATCGMTTATSLAAHGRLLSAGLTQPAGLLFALLVGGLFWLGGWIGFSGRPAAPVLAGLGRAAFSGRGLLTLLVVVGAAWAFKAAEVASAGAGAATRAAASQRSVPGA